MHWELPNSHLTSTATQGIRITLITWNRLEQLYRMNVSHFTNEHDNYELAKSMGAISKRDDTVNGYFKPLSSNMNYDTDIVLLLDNTTKLSKLRWCTCLVIGEGRMSEKVMSLIITSVVAVSTLQTSCLLYNVVENHHIYNERRARLKVH